MSAGRAQAVIFDFDGVLADTERLHLSAFQDVFAGRGWTLTDAAYYGTYLGFDDRDLVRAFTQANGIALGPGDLEAVLEAKVRRYAGHLESGQALFPGAGSCIRRMRSRYALAVASGSLRREITHILDAADLTRAFDAIVGADDVAASKPAPDLYAEAIRRLGVEPAMAVAVEDSRWGLESARAAGLRTIGITTSYPARELPQADAIIATLDELTHALVDALTAA